MPELKVYAGPMCAGKTRELIDYLDSSDSPYQAFRPVSPDRGVEAARVMASRDGDCGHVRTLPVPPVGDRFYDIVEAGPGNGYETVAIDDAQFFDEGLVDVVERLLDDGYDVAVAGLDRNFRGEPFEPVPSLQEMADEDVRLTAECEAGVEDGVCGAEATLSQRLEGEEAADAGAEQVRSEVDGVKYEPRCPEHHRVPLKA